MNPAIDMKVLVHYGHLGTKSETEGERDEPLAVTFIEYWNAYMKSANVESDLIVTVCADDAGLSEQMASHLCTIEPVSGIQWFLHEDSGKRALEEDDLLQFSHYLGATLSNTILLRFNEFCRANGICFASFFSIGFVGSVFYDEGPDSLDKVIVDPETIVEIVAIDNGRIRLSPDVSFRFAKGDVVKFSALRNAIDKATVFGTAELLNDKVFRVLEVFPEKNEISLDFSTTVTNYERALTNYEKGTGVLEKALQSDSNLSWMSWKDAIVRPNADITKASNYDFADQARFDGVQVRQSTAFRFGRLDTFQSS